MEVKVVSKMLVKPQTPTPKTLKNYKISFMDEVNPTMNVPMVFYYKSPAATAENLRRLQQSMSEILPSFYPFAGRYNKKTQTVDCSDQGALLTEAEVNLPMQEIVKLDAEELNDLLPCEIGEADEIHDPILRAQFNRFKCGGLAVSICISHKVVDVCSLGIFVSAWARAARGAERICPNFDGTVFFPGNNFPTPEFGITRDRENGLYKIVCKKFFIDNDTISALKARVGGKPRPPSRVAVVTGIVAKAVAASCLGQPLMVAQAVNIRERTVPPMSRHSIGNLVDLAITECSAKQTGKMGVEDYIRALGDEARKTVWNCHRLVSEDGRKKWIETSQDASKQSLREDLNVVWFTDCTKFGFYEADFGWGKPALATVVNVVVKNHVVLLNTKEGDGIEAWVQLEENAMPFFEKEMNNFFNSFMNFEKVSFMSRL